MVQNWFGLFPNLSEQDCFMSFHPEMCLGGVGGMGNWAGVGNRAGAGPPWGWVGGGSTFPGHEKSEIL